MTDLIPALTAAVLCLNLLALCLQAPGVSKKRWDVDDDEGLWHFLELNYGYPFLLLGCTAYFYIIVHFTGIAYDISGKDVMLGLAKQAFCFMVNGALLVRVMALGFYFGISGYRYMTYSAPPALPPCPKMQSPC